MSAAWRSGLYVLQMSTEDTLIAALHGDNSGSSNPNQYNPERQAARPGQDPIFDPLPALVFTPYEPYEPCSTDPL
jgi:hypothetical protein